MIINKNELVNVSLSILGISGFDLPTDLPFDEIIKGGVVILISLITFFCFIRAKRKKRTVFLYVKKESFLHNYHAQEAISSVHSSYDAFFVNNENPTEIYLSYSMPEDLGSVERTIELVHNNNIDLVANVNREQYFAENYYNDEDLFPHILHHGVTHDDNIRAYNTQLYDNICLLRKLESFYILYRPAYIRKPLYKGEEEI